MKQLIEINFYRGGPQSHVDLARKMQSNLKSTQRLLNACLKELAVTEAEKLKALNPQPKWYSVHRKDGTDTDFNSIFMRNAPEIKNESDGLSLIFLTASEDQGTKGNVLLFGDENAISTLAPQLCDLLDAKGKAKGQRFQAKANNMKKISECEKVISNYFDQK